MTVSTLISTKIALIHRHDIVTVGDVHCDQSVTGKNPAKYQCDYIWLLVTLILDMLTITH